MAIFSRGRLGQACVKLYETDDRISSLCFNIGLRSLLGVRRRFSRTRGMSPRAYRRKARRGLARWRTAG